MKKMKKKLLVAIFLSLNLIAFIVFVYSPSLIYFVQVDEFQESFFSLVFSYEVLGFTSSIVITILLSFFRVTWLKYLLSVFFLLALLLYLQVDFFAISYGILDGSEIDFGQFDHRGNAEILVLIVALILAVILRDWVAKNSTLIVVIMFVGLSGGLVFNAVSNPSSHSNSDAKDNEFNYYSTKKNVIIIVLDAFGSEYFQKILAEKPKIKNNYDGFVSYSDAISNYSATVGSIPSMLVGKMYPQNQKIKAFIETEVHNNGLPMLFEKMGYAVSFISASLNFRNIYPKRFLSDVTQDRKAYKNYNSLKLLDISLFKLSPHYLKPVVFAEGDWFFSKQAAEKTQIPNSFSERGKYFLDYVTENAVLDSDKPRFKVIHATIPHPNYDYNAQCEKHEYKRRDPESFKMAQQSNCALLLLNKLLDKYKSMGIYDNSLIVVTADHGARVYDNPEFTGYPSDFELSASGILFMIKGVGQTEPFKQVSQAFSLLKLKKALENEDTHTSDYSYLKDNKRLFYAYQPIHKSAKGYFSDAPLYEVSENFRNPKSWKLLDFITNNCIKQKLPLKMMFSKSNRSGYCGAFGFKQYGKSFDGIWSSSEDNRIIFGLDKQSFETLTQATLTLSLKPKLQGKQEKINLLIAVNDNLVGSKELVVAKTQDIDFTVPVSIFKNGDNVIQLLLPDIKSGKKLGINNNGNKLGVLIKQIQLNK